MNSALLMALANHLWQSTLFALVAGCVTLILRSNCARARYCVWLAASAKFLVPFAVLSEIGALLPRPLGSVHAVGPAVLAIAGQVVAPVASLGGAGVPALEPISHAIGYGAGVLILVGVLWALGTLVVAARWFTRWRLLRRALRESAPANLAFVIPVRSSASQLEPVVVGVLHPVLLIPEGLKHCLAAEEMDAVLAHEHGHVAWRDNLTATAHMLVEALFWFHPLVWWLGGRIVAERERACDERVLAHGYTPRSYAEGILKVCEHYLQSPLASAAGVGGANLGQRIASIMKNVTIERLGVVRKLALALAAAATIAIPLAAGMLTSPPAAAEAAAADAAVQPLRNVAIRLAPPPMPLAQQAPALYNPAGQIMPDGKRIKAIYSLRNVIASAYGVEVSRVVGRDLSQEPMYEVTADNPWPETPTDSGEVRGARYRRSVSELQPLQRDLLARHFGLVVRRERKQMDGYVLGIGSGGSKLKPYSDPNWQAMWGSAETGIDATDYPVGTLVRYLDAILRAPVVDATGLQGTYEYKVSWKSPGGPPDPVTVAKMLQEQLGLRLEAKPVTVEVINVVRVKSPQEVLTQPAGAD